MGAEPVPDEGLALASIAFVMRRASDLQCSEHSSPWNLTNGWRLNADNEHDLRLIDAGDVREVVLHFRGDGYEVELSNRARLKATGVSMKDGVITAAFDGVRMRARAVFEGLSLTLLSDGRVWRLALDDPMGRAERQEGGSGRLTAPMPGAVVAVLVAAGDAVERGQALMVIEAMKMEHTIRAAVAGRVAKIHFMAGQQVSDGDELLTIETEGA
jgi:3-methylcrotonyl-CoA carboxylase alpha subunit